MFPGWGGGKAGSPVAPDRWATKLSLSAELAHEDKSLCSPPHPNTSLPPGPRGELDVTFGRLLLRRLVAGAVRLAVGVLQGVLQAQLVAHLEGLAHRAHHAHGLALRSRDPPSRQPWAGVPQPHPPPGRRGAGPDADAASYLLLGFEDVAPEGVVGAVPRDVTEYFQVLRVVRHVEDSGGRHRGN